MTSRERMITALERGTPDRLPVTTHHVMRYFTDKYMGGINDDEFFDYFGMDAIRWLIPLKGDSSKGEYVRNGECKPALVVMLLGHAREQPP